MQNSRRSGTSPYIMNCWHAIIKFPLSKGVTVRGELINLGNETVD